MSRHRVVVTGMGVACPLGLTVNELWQGLLAGRSGIDPIRATAAKSILLKPTK